MIGLVAALISWRINQSLSMSQLHGCPERAGPTCQTRKLGAQRKKNRLNDFSELGPDHDDSRNEFIFDNYTRKDINHEKRTNEQASERASGQVTRRDPRVAARARRAVPSLSRSGGRLSFLAFIFLFADLFIRHSIFYGKVRE